jgi:hypothetical protein
MIGNNGQAGANGNVNNIEDDALRLAKIRPEALAERMWPYLQAYQDDDVTGDKQFDENVTSVRDLALFLARRIINPPYDDLI